MTSKLKCPFCQQELERQYDYNRDVLFHKCNKCYFRGDTILWQALIQAKQDLKIARRALKDARILSDTHCIASAVKTIDKALEQIEHKE